MTITPFQRAQNQGPVFTAEEVARLERRAVNRIISGSQASDPDRPPPEPKNTISAVDSYNDVFFERGSQVAVVYGEPRTSLITFPSNGRIPELTPEGQARRAERRESRSQFGQYDHPELRPLAERCIFFGSPSGPPMFPTGAYNSNYIIVQTPDYVMILIEMVHDARIVRFNSEHPPAHVRKWLGDSIGWWEDDTLVVETMNFHPLTGIRGSTPNAVLVERFTRISPHAIQYGFTVEDPDTWTRPWTAEVQLTKNDEPLYEYACHEGNYAMEGILAGARAEEKAAAQAANQGSR